MNKLMNQFVVFVSAIFISAALVFTFASCAQTQAPENDKDKLYSTWVKSSSSDQKQARETANEYLRKYGSDNDQRVKDIQAWLAKSNTPAASTEPEFEIALAAREYVRAFAIGRQILSTDPENLNVLLKLADAGNKNLFTGDTSLTTETIDYTRRAIKLLDPANAGRLPGNIDAERVRGNLQFGLGTLLAPSSPNEAAAEFRRAAQSRFFKNSPKVYLNLGLVTARLFKKQSEEYAAVVKAEGETPRSKSMKVEVDKLGEQTVDAYARAVALSNTPLQQDFRLKMMDLLTPIYKTLHNNSDAGLDELISKVLSKPMP